MILFSPTILYSGCTENKQYVHMPIINSLNYCNLRSKRDLNGLTLLLYIIVITESTISITICRVELDGAA